jgi:hypothetical protein
MRLQDAAYTKTILVTLAEVTPVSQAAALQEVLPDSLWHFRLLVRLPRVERCVPLLRDSDLAQLFLRGYSFLRF